MTTLPELKTVDTWDDDVRNLSEAIKGLSGPLEILEAGCGREWPLGLDGVEYRLTGVDLDAEAIQSRVDMVRDLDEAIIGDLSVKGTIPAGHYDVIYSSFVLEHISDAEGALERMLDGLKPGGLLLLRFPDRKAVYGWTASRTPFFVHVAYYRHFLRIPDAGKPGHAPYRTFHAPVVAREGIRDFCRRHGCSIVEEWGHTYYVRGNGFRSRLTKLYAKSLWLLSFGRLAWRHNNLTYVIRKAEAIARRSFDGELSRPA